MYSFLDSSRNVTVVVRLFLILTLGRSVLFTWYTVLSVGPVLLFFYTGYSRPFAKPLPLSLPRTPPPRRCQMLWLRALGGFFSGVLCSGVMSQSGPCPRSSSCARCGALPGSRYFSEISRGSRDKGDVDYDGRGGRGSSGSSSAVAGLARADVRWHVGVVLGLLVGGLTYGRRLGWGWLADRPAFVACAAASSCALVAAAAWWGWRGGGEGAGAGRSPTGLSCLRRRRQTSTAAARRRGGGGRSWGWSFRRSRKLSGVEYARPSGQEEAEEGGDDEAEMPLLGGGSVHNPSRASAELPRGKARDMEAGGGPGCEVDRSVSSR